MDGLKIQIKWIINYPKTFIISFYFRLKLWIENLKNIILTGEVLKISNTSLGPWIFLFFMCNQINFFSKGVFNYFCNF